MKETQSKVKLLVIMIHSKLLEIGVVLKSKHPLLSQTKSPFLQTEVTTFSGTLLLF